MNIFNLLFIIFFTAGCGYYPISYYSKKAIGEDIYVESIVNLSDPENSVIAKDALNQAITTRFHSNLVSKDMAKTIITIEIVNVDLYSIADNKEGFANFYRASVNLSFTYTDKKGNLKKFKNYGYYDFTVDTLSTITDERRFVALREASLSAIDKFVSQVAYNWQ
ncbi:LPS assembly lipoprotein LptE [Helicobacter sp. MIT 14-3879]|uniref:LPS assembly lipoprotein LptE n=1 Tax=Helicobacter sp. MIT 14-3879 TaxID=2040649 RepID=UPI000E1F44A2|nr:LPS assembly lipoprotein LptE [Helicobacter sp. MIT 14-3879]RDU65436.1 hypothetical protein CQA44_00125 [Helicobacter sp. MIT 14-3879]